MKRKTIVSLLFMVLIGFSGCHSQKVNETEKNQGFSGKVSLKIEKNVKKIDVSKLKGREKAVYETVDKYMTALKNKDAGTLVEMSRCYEQFPIEDRDKIKEAAVTSFQKILMETGYTIDKFRICNIEMKKTFARVYVCETLNKDMGKGFLETKTLTFYEEFFISERKEKWEITSFEIFEFKGFDLNEIRNPEQLRKLSGNLGAGRTFTLMIDPSTSLCFLETDKLDTGLRDKVEYFQCQSNVRNIGTVLEIYSTDNAGHYPVYGMKAVTPKYLKMIPTCPAAGKDTYSSTFKCNVGPDAYTYFCCGHYHKNVKVPAGFPQYNSTQGLVLKP